MGMAKGGKMKYPKCPNKNCTNYNSQQLTIPVADENIKYICLGCDHRWLKNGKEEGIK